MMNAWIDGDLRMDDYTDEMMITTNYQLLTTNYSLPTTHYQLLTTNYSLSSTTHYYSPILPLSEKNFFRLKKTADISSRPSLGVMTTPPPPAPAAAPPVFSEYCTDRDSMMARMPAQYSSARTVSAISLYFSSSSVTGGRREVGVSGDDDDSDGD